MCVGVQCGKNLLFHDKFYNGGIFDQKGVRNLMFFTVISGTLIHTGIPMKNEIWMPETQGKKGVRNLGAPVLAAHLYIMAVSTPSCHQQLA